MAHNDLRQHIESLFSTNGSSPDSTALCDGVLDSVRNLLDRSLVRAPSGERELEQHFHGSEMPYHPSDVTAYLDFLKDIIVPNSVNLASPYCLGHMTGAVPSLMQLLAQVMVGLNQNLVKQDASTALTRIDRQTLAILHQLVFQNDVEFYRRHAQADGETLGTITSCGTLANLTALWCARNRCFPGTAGAPSVEEDGLPEVLRFHGYERAVILGSHLMHYSVDKAARVLGLGSGNVLKLPVDEYNRVDVAEIAKAIDLCERRRWRVMAIIAVAGTTECGTVDSLASIARLAHQHGIHLHIDAASGGPLLFSTKHRGRVQGIEEADSVTIDGHKQLYTPIGVSALIFRNPQAAKSIEIQANYILRNGSGDLGKVSVEGSRPASSLFLHAALHLFGVKGYEYLIDDNIEKAQLLAELIRKSAEFELLAEPETNIVVYRYIPERLRFHLSNGGLDRQANERINLINVRIQEAQYEAGKTFVSRTTLSTLPAYRDSSIVCLRAVIVNPLVREHHLQSVLEDQIRIAQLLELETVAPV